MTDVLFERYVGPEGEATKSVTFAWHATGTGDVEFFRSVQPGADVPGTPATEYTTPAEPQAVTFYVVAREGRGGTDWLVRTVEVRCAGPARPPARPFVTAGPATGTRRSPWSAAPRWGCAA